MTPDSPSHLPEATVLTRRERSALAALARFATQLSGIRLPESKYSMLHGRVKRRMRQVGIDSIEEYAKRVLTSSEKDPERVHFLDNVTTNKTEFFREAQHFLYLGNRALPALSTALGDPSRWHARLWCAGCSTGQEAYTLAMVLSEHARERDGFSFSITATDLSSQVLNVAARAIYSEDDVASVPHELRLRYLMRSKDSAARRVRVVPELRECVEFKRLNFMNEGYSLGGSFDVIFFRNVLIYFDRPTQEAVLRRQCEKLRPGGYLFVSHSESLAGLDVPLEGLGGSVFRKPTS